MRSAPQALWAAVRFRYGRLPIAESSGRRAAPAARSAPALVRGESLCLSGAQPRAAGLSLGVNLNPDKVCNFDCIYCQVDRTRLSETRFVELDALLAELDAMLIEITSGAIYATDKFRMCPARSAD